MNWFSGTSDDDEIFNGYVIKLIEDKKHEIQTAIHDLQSYLDKWDGLCDRLVNARIDSAASERCAHEIEKNGYSARHDILTALSSITEVDRTISSDLHI